MPRRARRALAAAGAIAGFALAGSPASAAPSKVEETVGAARGAVEATLQSLPTAEPPATSPLTDVLPTLPAPPRPVAPPPANGGTAVSEGSGTPAEPEVPDSGQPQSSPARTYVSTPATAVADARESGARAPQPPNGTGAGRARQGPSGNLRFAIPVSATPADPPLESAAPVAAEEGRSQPLALSDWLSSGPPLPGVFVYLAVFAGGLAIVFSMRRELGLHLRRRRRF